MASAKPMEFTIKNARAIDLSDAVPPSAVAATIRAEIEPRDGKMFIYSPVKIGEPTLFSGPTATCRVPLGRHRVVYVQLLGGATFYRIVIVGWDDGSK